MTATPQYKISQVLQQFLPKLAQNHALSGHQRSVLQLISVCKTAALGGHLEQCDACAYQRIHYNSCGNRHCPNCQGVNKEVWLHKRQKDLLPVKYFHAVFTVPQDLQVYFRYNKKRLYDLLMVSVRETLQQFGWDPRSRLSAKIGGIILLHTWTQQMAYHPHVHCIVAAGGLDSQGNWKSSAGNGNFLFAVRAMSVVFRAKLLGGIEKLYMAGRLSLPKDVEDNHISRRRKLYRKKWVVYAKSAFGGPTQVLEYLGRYTHKICISNYRILKVSSSHVTFRYMDRRTNKSCYKTLSGEAFVALFAEHILPKRFVKIRHFGFLSSRSKQADLAKVRKSLGVEAPKLKAELSKRQLIKEQVGKDPYCCPKCEEGEMVIIAIIPATRGSPAASFCRPIAKDRKVKLKKS